MAEEEKKKIEEEDEEEEEDEVETNGNENGESKNENGKESKIIPLEIPKDEKVEEALIEDEMKSSYIDYAMSVIVSRAIPSAEDGLKPVHRRILYAMKGLNLEPDKPTKKSARIVGECFVEGTQILTTRGLLPIQEVERGEFVYTHDGISEVAELYEMPEKELLKVTINNGISNITTFSQKFKILNKNLEYEWKEAKDLTEEDFIVIKTDYPNLKENFKLKLFNNKYLELNENLAYLLGQFLSDGWIEKKTNRIGFCSASEKIINKIASILKTEFGYVATIEQRIKPYNTISGQLIQSQLYLVRINNRLLCNFLANSFNLYDMNAYTKEIPCQIFTSPKNVIYSFISGLIDGDGSIHKSRNVINYSSVSEKLINKLLLLTQHLGILGRKSKLKPTKHSFSDGRIVKSNYPSYHIEFKGEFSKKLAQNLKLSEEKKNERIKRIISIKTGKSNFEIIPFLGDFIFSELSDKHLGGGWYRDKENRKFRFGIKHPCGCKIRYKKNLKQKDLRRSQLIEWGILEKLKRINSEYYKFLKEIFENKIFFIKVKKIEKVCQEKTYDFEVKNNHEFVANGFISHNCMGKYHPHGDMAIYDAMVRMAQPFSLRYPLVHGQGNFGSSEDPPAASRYTEAKLSKIAMELLEDLDKETVKFLPNFDNSLKEPEVLPAKIPNLLINGSSGIAVGMMTSMPPHNLSEVCEAIQAYIKNPDITIEKLREFILGPDFPTYGTIYREGLKEVYETGRGRFVVRGKAGIEEKKDRVRIVITELPYQVNKAELIIAIAKLVQDKKIPDISDIRDESAKEAIRVVILLKRGANAKLIMNRLFKLTNLEIKFNCILLALVHNQPRILNLKQLIEVYVKHRQKVIRKRTEFNLNEAKDRVHILEGLLIALEDLDRVIALIKKSNNVTEATENLITKYKLSQKQAQAILEMKLQRLTALEQDKIKKEHKALMELIKELEKILSDEKEILEIIKKEVSDIKRKYGDERRTKISERTSEIKEIDLIKKEDVAVIMTSKGYIKRMPMRMYQEQHRGGKGISGTDLTTGDFVQNVFTCDTHDQILFLTERGKLYLLKAYNIPEATRYSKGKAIINLLKIQDKIKAVIPVVNKTGSVLIVTKKGIAKRVNLDEFIRIGQSGVMATKLPPDDSLVDALVVEENGEVIIATKKGIADRFDVKEIREMGKAAYGVTAIKLDKGDEVIGVQTFGKKALEEIEKEKAESKQATILTITEKGFGKRTAVTDYRKTARAAKGIINIDCSDRNGDAVSIQVVNSKDSIIVTTAKGMVIRAPVKDIRIMGRNTQGVKIIRIAPDDKVTDLIKLKEMEDKE